MTIDTEEFLATGFQNVDKSTDIGKLVECLRFLEGLPSFEAYKTKSIERLFLKPGDIAVDLGCGLGFDLPKLAKVVSPGGKAIGIDISEKLLGAAKRAFTNIEEVSFRLEDIHELNISTNSVNGVRIDRALQHVRAPQKVISEMVRILKPGGWAVCAEPDWSTFIIDSESVETTKLVANRWSEGFRNPQIGRELVRRLRNANLQNVWIDGFVLWTDGISETNIVYDVLTTARKLSEEHEQYKENISRWIIDLKKRDSHEGLSASVTLFLAGGQKKK